MTAISHHSVGRRNYKDIIALPDLMAEMCLRYNTRKKEFLLV